MYSTDIYTWCYYWHTLYGIIFIYQNTHTHTQLMMYNHDIKIMFLIKCRINHETTLWQFYNVLSQSTNNKHQKAWLEILHSLHTSFKTKGVKPRYTFKNKYFVSFTWCFLFIESSRPTTGSTFVETQFPWKPKNHEYLNVHFQTGIMTKFW